MGAGPGAVHRVALVDESDMDVVGPYSVQEPVQEPLVRLLLGGGAHGDGGGMGQDFDVGPDGAEVFSELLGGLSFQLLKGVHPEPDQQGVCRGKGQALSPQLPEGCLEIGVAREEPLPLLLGPDVVRLKTQGSLELGKAPQLAEADLIQAGEGKGVQKLIVNLDGLVLGIGGNHPGDKGVDGRGAVALEDADPLVALLDVKPAHVFVAADGVPDALPQVGHAQLHPFGGKLCVSCQKGHEVGGKGGGPSGGLGAHNPLGGDADEPHVHPAGGHGVVQNFIQHLRIRITSPDDTIPVMLLPRLQRFGVLLVCFLSAQWNSSPAGHFVWLCGSYYRESSGKTQGRKIPGHGISFSVLEWGLPLGEGRSFYRPARIKETQGEFWVDFWEILWYSAFADNRLLQKFATLAYATGSDP